MSWLSKKVVLKVFVCLSFAVICFALTSSKASAHPNTVDWPGACASTLEQTGWAAYDLSASSYAGYAGTTVNTTIRFDARGCHTQTATSAGFFVRNSVNGINGFGPFQNVFGQLMAVYPVSNVSPGFSSIRDVNISFTIQPGDTYGSRNHCFTYFGRGTYGGTDSRNSGDGGFCFSVQSLGSPPPPSRPGQIIITKYGDDDNKADACLSFFLSQIGCMGNAHQSTFTNLGIPGGGFNYSVRASTAPGWGISKIHVNQYNGNGVLIANYDTLSNVLNPAPLVDGGTTFVDILYYLADQPPNGNFESLTCDRTNPIDPKLKASGWAFDRSNLNRKIGVAFWRGNASAPLENLNYTVTADGVGRPAESFAGIPISGHLFANNLPNSFNNGQQPYIYAYALGITPSGALNNDNPLIGRFQITNSLVAGCQPRPVFYPWLQTKNGDVTAVDKIIGQDLFLPGARGRGTSELDYALISKFPESTRETTKNFCTPNEYVLGQPQPLKNCSAGNYNFTEIGLNNIKTSVESAYQRNGNGAGTSCSPYNTVNVTSAASKVPSAVSGCKRGTIYKAGVSRSAFNYNLSDIMASQSITKGRATILVPGNLIIDTNLTYSYSGPYGSPQELPNIGIYVDGLVSIAPGVGQVDASIVAKEQIRSCANYASASCQNSLIAHGYWASGNGFQFGRNYFRVEDPNNNPAEQIILTGQSVAFPPPGFSRSDGDINSGLQIDGGELPPRLN